MSDEEMRVMVAAAWAQVKQVDSAERRVREVLDSGGHVTDLGDDDVWNLLCEIADKRRALHPLLTRFRIYE